MERRQNPRVPTVICILASLTALVAFPVAVSEARSDDGSLLQRHDPGALVKRFDRTSLLGKGPQTPRWVVRAPPGRNEPASNGTQGGDGSNWVGTSVFLPRNGGFEPAWHIARGDRL